MLLYESFLEKLIWAPWLKILSRGISYIKLFKRTKKDGIEDSWIEICSDRFYIMDMMILVTLKDY